MEHDGSQQPHLWMAFADLMAALLGVFVLFFVWMVVFESELAGDLQQAEQARVAAEEAQAQLKVAKQLEVARREAAEAKMAAERARVAGLQSALARSLARGGVSLSDDGRIGITGSLLFDLYKAKLSEEGSRVLAELGQPLARWLAEHDELVMVGGFTDDLPIHGEDPDFADNWQLSTERALTVVRALAAAGVPPQRMYAAGFGAQHPAVPNSTEEGRAQNRRVEIVPQRRWDR